MKLERILFSKLKTKNNLEKVVFSKFKKIEL